MTELSVVSLFVFVMIWVIGIKKIELRKLGVRDIGNQVLITLDKNTLDENNKYKQRHNR